MHCPVQRTGRNTSKNLQVGEERGKNREGGVALLHRVTSPIGDDVPLAAPHYFHHRHESRSHTSRHELRPSTGCFITKKVP
ncbi:unnamed protein product [Trifolium pratense]|uniref:Uncharacterized protein n=1 Tax=Trifolium pratense TaxID=57577 RepID=A0ACB0K8N4_TRIPR|nr:unnamed protein product [Trifolium pratense]